MLHDASTFSSFSVNDLDAAQQFYGETLGLDVSVNDMGVLELHLAGGAEAVVYDKGVTHTPATFTVLNFRVADIDTAVDALTARGVQFEQYAYTNEHGVSRRGGQPIAWFTDPAGNILSVIETA